MTKLAATSRRPRAARDLRQPRSVAARLGHWLHTPPGTLALFAVAIGFLLLADHLCLTMTRVAVQLVVNPNALVVNLDGQQLTVALDQPATAVVFESAAPDVREYQIDGTDNTNNLTESAADLTDLIPTPEYQLEAWMRGAYSSWSDIATADAVSGRTTAVNGPVPAARSVAVAAAGTTKVSAWLERPESPVSIMVKRGAVDVGTVHIDRNARSIMVTGAGLEQVQAYFPERPLPFVAELLDSSLRVAIWSWVLLIATSLLTLVVHAAWSAFPTKVSAHHLTLLTLWRHVSGAFHRHGLWGRPWRSRATTPGTHNAGTVTTHVESARWPWRPDQLSSVNVPDLVAVVISLAAFAWVAWIARVQFQAEPHILDASAYYFQAKIFASGRLSAPAPADIGAFQGPFMVIWQGRWFAQYPPMTSLLLALGMILHAAWIVEPVLGTAALAGIYLIGRRLFGPLLALIALALGALSPFYAYLAASYLSHTVALFFEVYFVWFLILFAGSLKTRHLVAAAACLAAMFCTRELSAVLVGATACTWLAIARWRAVWANLFRVVPSLAIAAAVLMTGFVFYLSYNLLQTGDPLLLPRTLFSPADRYGFGAGIGFYGQHTFAAGMVVLDQLLTSLLIDLYGWPFYLTLALVPLAFFRRDANSRWDWFCVTCAAVIFLAQAGYFYHGIFLGPRYLYETLPFILLLTARGVIALAHACGRIARKLALPGASQSTFVVARYATAAVCALLLAFNLGFYLPRQVTQHTNFTGLPATLPVDATAIYQAHLRNAVVVTDNWMIYNYVLWPLNDPDLKASVIYAYAPTQQAADQVASEFPRRRLLRLIVDAHGHVAIVP